MPTPPADAACPIFDAHGNVRVDSHGRVMILPEGEEPEDENPQKVSWQAVALVLLSLVFGIAQWIASRELADVTGRIAKLEANVARNNDRITTIETLVPRLRERLDEMEADEREHRALLNEVELLLDQQHAKGGGVR